MSLIVQKYGGSSVASLDHLRRVAARIMKTREAGHEVVVVVSAMGKMTSELLSRARALTSENLIGSTIQVLHEEFIRPPRKVAA